jgi:hypothetical protein
MGPKQPVTRFFVMRKTEDLEKCIAGIQRKACRDFFKKEINSLLNLKLDGELIKTAQRGGHCDWASLKGLFHGVIETECLKIYSDQNEAKKEALRIYKAWKPYICDKAYEHYLQTSTNPNSDLIERIQEKKQIRAAKKQS